MLLVPCPPSDRMDSKMARYSGVNGAGIAPPRGWLWSYRPGPPIERHFPLNSGYFVSSHAWALAIVTHSAATNAIVLIERQGMVVLPLARILARCREALRPHRLSRGGWSML